MPVSALKITPARRYALDVLKDAAVEGAVVHESNCTSRVGWTVHWQVLGWLVKHGFVSVTFGTRPVVQLTDRGRERVGAR